MKIATNTEYLNQVHNRWLPVPPHWVGLDSSAVSDKLYFTRAADFSAVGSGGAIVHNPPLVAATQGSATP